MGILHRRPARHFVDYHVKNDTKLIKWIKHHPVIYDKSHKYHGNKQEQEKIWECIAKGLNKTVQACKERWYQLVKEYKKRTDHLSLHDIVISLLDTCFKRPKAPKNSCVEEIEDDVLPQLFTEDIEGAVGISNYPTISISNHDLEYNEYHDISIPEEQLLQQNTMRSFFSDSGLDLMEEARSLPPSEMSFTGLRFFYNDEELPPIEAMLYNSQHPDDYYNYFVENVAEDLNEHPFVFGEILESLMENMTEEVSTEARKDIVRMLCDRLKNSNQQSRQ